MSVKVTVGVCVKNSEKMVKTALHSVVKQDFPHKLMRLVVVDDGSTDETLSVVRDFTSKMDIKTVVFSSGEKGPGASRQIVVDNAEGDYIVWVDDDIILKKNFIRKHVEFMEKNPSVGAASANQIPTRKSLVDTLESIGQLLPNPNPETIGTGGSIFRLKAIKQIGGFDINIKGAGEDQDISQRIKESGWALSRNSSSEFYHKHPPTTWRTLWDRHLWYGYGRHFRFHKYKRKNLLWEPFPHFALVIGFKNSCRIYEITHEKRTFFLAPFYFFRSIADCLGFIRAHLDGYGHIASNEGRSPVSDEN
jgi:glycosyltransferase involved in cell wall biosynthesis